jgi:phytoene dehydrogenase-like protein
MAGAEGLRCVVVGGGHNGLVAAALMAKRLGAQVTVLERRSQVGGAAITETPWGPEFKVTALSYVVSLLPPSLRRELQLERHGYKVHPQGPYFAPSPDGRALALPDDPRRRHEEIARFSRHDADAMVQWDAWLGGLADVLGPLLTTVPPRLGSRRPADISDQLRLAWRLRGLGVRGVADVTRLFTMSIADVLDWFFESPRVQGLLAVSGVIGTWAGPRSAGTAYVMAHHKIGDVGDGKVGAWGFPEGGMGAVSNALRSAAAEHGVLVRTDAAVERILTANGRARGVVLTSGEELRADLVVAATHPKITFLEHLERSELPDDFVRDIERWQSRSGTVKVNLAVSKLPEFTSRPGFDPDVHGGTIVLAPSLDHLELAFQEAVGGRAATRPFADVCIPSVFDRSLCPEGTHIVSMFTQWVPHGWAQKPEAAALDAYAERIVDAMEEVAPGFRDSVLHRQVIGPHEMEQEYGLVGGNIFHGELSPSQLFHLRPAPGYADYTTPIRGLYQCSSATHGGGGVTGIPGMNVVGRIRADLGARRRRELN